MLCDEHGLKSNISQAGVREGNSDWKKLRSLFCLMLVQIK